MRAFALLLQARGSRVQESRRPTERRHEYRKNDERKNLDVGHSRKFRRMKRAAICKPTAAENQTTTPITKLDNETGLPPTL